MSRSDWRTDQWERIVAEKDAELTTARQEIAALTRERDAARANHAAAHENWMTTERLAAEWSDKNNDLAATLSAVLSYLGEGPGADSMTGDEWLTAIKHGVETHLRVAEARIATLRAQHRAAVEALRALRNEGHAILAVSYDAIKDSAGYTNLRCFQTRLDDADAILTPASPDTAPVDHTRTIVRDLGTELASQVMRADGLQAAITQARAELLALQPWNERIDAALEVLDGALVVRDTAPVGEDSEWNSQVNQERERRGVGRRGQ